MSLFPWWQQFTDLSSGCGLYLEITWDPKAECPEGLGVCIEIHIDSNGMRNFLWKCSGKKVSGDWKTNQVFLLFVALLVSCQILWFPLFLQGSALVLMELWVRCVIYQAKPHVPKRNIYFLKLLCHLNTSLSFSNLFLFSAIFFFSSCQVRSLVSLPSIFCISCKILPPLSWNMTLMHNPWRLPAGRTKSSYLKRWGWTFCSLEEQDSYMVTRE